MLEAKIVEHIKEILDEIQKSKLEIEKDPLVVKFIESLFENNAWEAVDQVLLSSAKDGRLVYVPSHMPREVNLDTIIQELFDKEARFFDKVVAGVTEQFNGIADQNGLNAYLNRLLVRKVLQATYEQLRFCSKCQIMRLSNGSEDAKAKCESCSSDLWIVNISHLASRVKQSLLNNQFLELYVKESLVKAQFRMISKELPDAKVYTSIPWRVVPRSVEIDVGAVKGNSLILCECKTSRITLNTVDEKIGQVFHILDSFERAYNEKPDIDLFFITTETIEPDVPVTQYSSMKNIRVHFYDRQVIPKLTELFSSERAKLA